MKLNTLILTIVALTGAMSTANAAFQCSGYHISVNDNDGMIRVNGEKVTSQKIAFIKEQGDYANTKTDMGLMPARDGNMYGFQFIKRNGKAWLNVQLLQNAMDAPKIIGSFPCKKVAD
ncbi:hypothetical protein [Photorhabdus heterorhabditis]|uniref:hypothetical protein n=1 Tax=Photorhabdus heterorhabditis TaxID=880156 RepID=UPI0015620D19|nr:hypothetical protein [Photorhabdus heterorhabditis subsp. aluminescens]